MCIYSLPLYIPLVLCTCNEASSSRVIRNIAPVQVIIDEAAMATEPESMVAIKLASEHVTLIGDHMQLQVRTYLLCLFLLCILNSSPNSATCTQDMFGSISLLLATVYVELLASQIFGGSL